MSAATDNENGPFQEAVLLRSRLLGTFLVRELSYYKYKLLEEFSSYSAWRKQKLLLYCIAQPMHKNIRASKYSLSYERQCTETRPYFVIRKLKFLGFLQCENFKILQCLPS